MMILIYIKVTLEIIVCYFEIKYKQGFLGWKAELELNEMCEDTWR